MAGLIAPLIFSLITFTPGAYARRGGFGGGIADAIAGLDLDPIDKTKFCFSVIFALVAAIQLLQSLRNIFHKNRQNPDYTINTGVPFVIALLLTTSTLVAFYVMNSVQIAIDDNLDSLIPINFTIGYYVSIGYPLYGILPELAEIFFLTGLFIIIRHRVNVNQISYPRWKTILDGTFILLLLISSVTQAGIYGTPGVIDQNMVNAFRAFTHLYVAFYILTAVNIVATAIVFRQKSLRLATPDKILRNIVVFVCPWIAIHAVYELVFDIVYWVPTDPLSQRINYEAVFLADLLIYGFSFAFAVGAALRLGVHPVNPKGLQQGTDGF